MTKHHRAASALAALFCASTAQAQTTGGVEIYGNLSVGVAHHTGTDGVKNELVSGFNSASIFGFRGREDLGGGSFAVFNLATGPVIDTGASGAPTNFFNAYSYVGLSDNKLGTVTIGRNAEFTPEVCQTNVMCVRSLVELLDPGNLDRKNSSFLNDMFKYQSPDFGPVRVQGYLTKTDPQGANGRSYGAEVYYGANTDFIVVGTYEHINSLTISPLSKVAGFGIARLFDTPVTPSTSFQLDTSKLLSLSTRFRTGPMIYYGFVSRVQMIYQGQTESLVTENTGASYDIPNTVASVTLGLAHSTLATGHWNTVMLGANYYLSKRTTLFLVDGFTKSGGPYASAQQLVIGGNSRIGGSDSTLGMGIRIIF